MSDSVFLTGGTGFIGAHLKTQLEAAGYAVCAPGRRELDLEALSPDALTHSLRGQQTVVHCAGLAHEAVGAADAARLLEFNRDLTVRLYDAAARADVARFVWLSSVKVLGETSSQPLPVDAPLRPQGAYGQSKAAAEQALRERSAAGGPALVIVRPPLVYGPCVRANFRRLLHWALSGRGLPLGEATAERSMIGIRNLCDALQATLSAPAGIYHVADRDSVSVASLLQAVADAGNQPLKLWRCPPRWLALGARLTGRSGVYERLFEPLLLETKDSEAQLCWQPEHSLQAQLEETVQWFRNLR